MNILIVGSGGREHALAWKAAQSTQVKKVYVAPGNAGTALEAKLENINIAADDIDSLLSFATQKNIDLTIVGPEQPLVQGIVDEFQHAGLRCFGPSKSASQLEGSKAFSKDFLARHHIPTANYQTFTDTNAAIAYIKKMGAPIVIKADGLAAGKGVILADSESQAIDAVTDMLDANRFGDAGHRVIIEEFLTGEEASFIVMVDGEHVLPLATSQDHKAAYDADQGPNTGGMGACSPAPLVTEALHQHIMQQIILPTIQGMASDGIPYCGFLYAGLMIDQHNNIKVLEFNCRFGDPETQAIIMRLQSDLVSLCLAAVDKTLHTVSAKWDTRPAVAVVLAAEGYPESYQKGRQITGLTLPDHPDRKIFHAGTVSNGEQILTNGGRVLAAVALGNSFLDAQQGAYELSQQLHWDGVWYRHDIGYRAINHEQAAKMT